MPLKKKIGQHIYTWINDYRAKQKASKEAKRWLRDGFSVKIIKSRRKKVTYPYSLWVAEHSRKK